MATDPRRQVVDEARRVLAAMERVGFHSIARKRLEQAILWMEEEVRTANDNL